MNLTITYYLTGGANISQETTDYRSVEEARKAHVELLQITEKRRTLAALAGPSGTHIIVRDHITAIDIRPVEAS